MVIIETNYIDPEGMSIYNKISRDHECYNMECWCKHVWKYTSMKWISVFGESNLS
jgi:hypothetical protein